MMEILDAEVPAPVVVTGMHRSGTSAVAQLLASNGFHLGDASDLLGPTEFNVHGHFERAEIVDFNDRVLATASSSWRLPPEHGQPPPVSRDLVEEGERLLARVASGCGADNVPLVKDPRVALLMPLWRRIAGPDALFVFCVRNPASVARSLSRRDDMTPTDGVSLWMAYCRSFATQLGDAKHVVIDTDRIHADVRYRRLVVTALARECNLPEDSLSDTFDDSVFHEPPSLGDFERLVPVEGARQYASMIFASEDVQVHRGGGAQALSAETRDAVHPVPSDLFHFLGMQAAREHLSAAQADARRLTLDLENARAKLRHREMVAEWQRQQFLGREDWVETPDGLWVQRGEQPDQLAERARAEVERTRSEAERARGEADFLREQVRARRDESVGREEAHADVVKTLTNALADAAHSHAAAVEGHAQELTAAQRRERELEQQLRETLSVAQRREVELEQQLRSAEQVLAGVLSSRSWRITRPLRRNRGNDAAVMAQNSDALSATEVAHLQAQYPSVSWDWYLAQNPDVAEQGIDPAWHYHHFGWREGRRPVSWFDPAPHGIDGGEPFSRYLLQDLVERSREASSPTTVVREAPRSAVSLHLFYPEFIPRFEDRLAALDADVDVLVTTPEGFDTSWHERWVGLPRVGELVIRSAPNRGRNFGPLLVEFGERLLEYSYVIHAHSKKSLRTGREQLDWAEECLEAALPISGRLAERLHAMEEDATIGGYRPGVSRHLPYWAHHWLQNAHWGRHADVSDTPPQDSFLEYPVGGMFVVKTASISPLLSKRWSYADFPVEFGQADGTLQHAVERLVGHLVTQAGQRFAVPPSQDQTPVREFVLRANSAELERVAERGFLEDPNLTVSFDLFDTLIERRGLMTEQAKWVAGRKAAALGIVGAEEYVELRNRIERDLRSQLAARDDVSLHEVADECARAMGLIGSEAADVASVLASAETNADADILVARRGLFSIFVQRLQSGSPTIVVSDSYYSSDDLAQILKSLGAPISAEKVLSSASTGARKDRGDIWEMLAQEQSLGAGSFLHVGDNVVSDIQRPMDRQIPTVHVLSARDRWHLATGRLLSQPQTPPGRAELGSVERVLASELGGMELARVLERSDRRTFATG